MKSSGIGGQAVLEGVMMRNHNRYAVAVRTTDGKIAIENGTCSSVSERCALFRIPIIRGVVSFVESLILGTKTLTSSASYFEEEEKPSRFELWLQKVFGKKADSVIMGFAAFLGVLLAVGLFIFLPAGISALLPKDKIPYAWRTLIEGCIRLVIFILYLVLISVNRDMKRVFMYHGAEHKTINCIEHGMALNVKNVRKSSRLHKRCGTSFLLFVILISVVFFIFIRIETFWLRIVVRIAFVPVIAGISYEFLRLAGRSDHKLVNVLAKPGLMLQKLTTREPDDEMIRVAIASVESVFDWKAYIDDNFNNKVKFRNEKKTESDGEKNYYFPEQSAEDNGKVTILEENAGRNAKKNATNSAKKADAHKKNVSASDKTDKTAGKDSGAISKKENKQETAAKNEKIEASESVQKANESKPADSEGDDIAAKFDMNFVSDPVKKEDAKPTTEKKKEADTVKEETQPEISEEEQARISREKLAAKVKASDLAEEEGKRRNLSRVAEVDEEEDDDLLRALDRYFVFEGEKTVMERGQNNK